MKINWKLIGPGIVLAAAGVGAGDVVASGVAGASYGMILLWALLIGALFKFFLNEGMARYQLASGETFMEGYTKKSRWFNYYFIFYLVIWSFVVGGALLSGIGLVTSAMFPFISLKAGAVICALIVLSIVISGKYKIFERIMKFLALVMFVTFLISAITVLPSFVELIKGLLIPKIPNEGGLLISMFKTLALLGGVGGTVTIMAYGYWLKENKTTKPEHLNGIRVDLLIGYFVTFIFAMCVMIVAAALIHPIGGTIAGKQGIIDLAVSLSQVLGSFGYWAFVIGFWAAVFSSLMSFYQAIPYLFADSLRLLKKKFGKKEEIKINMSNKFYKAYVLYCVFPPMLLLFLEQPIFLILAYSVLGALFMPFLALMLLIVGNDKKLGKLKNKAYYNAIMVVILIVMVIISFWPLIDKWII